MTQALKIALAHPHIPLQGLFHAADGQDHPSRQPGTDLDIAFMVMGYVFCLSAAFALAKMLRDAHEADLSVAARSKRRKDSSS